MSLKTTTLRVVIPLTARATGHRQRSWQRHPRPRSGFRSRVWACGRAGIPGRPRNVASQPAPETSATAAGTLSFEPLPREGFFRSPTRCHRRNGTAERQCPYPYAYRSADRYAYQYGDDAGTPGMLQEGFHRPGDTTVPAAATGQPPTLKTNCAIAAARINTNSATRTRLVPHLMASPPSPSAPRAAAASRRRSGGRVRACRVHTNRRALPAPMLSRRRTCAPIGRGVPPRRHAR